MPIYALKLQYLKIHAIWCNSQKINLYSTVLVNTTYYAAVQLNKEGNYSCVATSKYGIDVKNFLVLFPGKKKLFYQKFIYNK